MALDLARIDQFLRSLEGARDDDELRRLFDTYNAEFDLGVPPDPYSQAYRDHQFSIYEWLFGKPYSTRHEQSLFDVASAARAPFPYMHGSYGTVGDQLIAIGFLIKAMALPKGARILEFGPGWGNTTLALAKMGYQVTAIDIEPNFVALIEERARMERIEGLEVLLGDFSVIEDLRESYDAILFFECFHHCSDHLRLIAAFDKALKPGGIVCFAAEPIVPEFPIPWGLRMDGQSLWAIRRNGWLELGFNKTYFEETMRRHGWWLEQHRGQDSPLAKAFIARRASELCESWHFGRPGLRSLVGRKIGTQVATDGRAGYLMYGPYVPRPSGKYVAQVKVDSRATTRGWLRVEVVADAGQRELASDRVDMKPGLTAIDLPFVLDTAWPDLEIRAYCECETLVTLEGASLALRTSSGGDSRR